MRLKAPESACPNRPIGEAVFFLMMRGALALRMGAGSE
jgi:hypothetical protein